MNKLKSLKNAAIVLRFLVITTKMWDLMDIYAFCMQKRLVKFPSRFS